MSDTFGTKPVVKILHTNDFHGKLDDRRQSQLAALREQADLYFDCGDLIAAGNLAIPIRPDPSWPRLEALRCSASVLGNRETHVLEAPWRAKLAGARHPLLCGNLRQKKSGEYPLPRTLEFDVAGTKVGVLAVMVPMVTERMASKAASAYVWDPPIATAVSLAKNLRDRVECLVALTHIGYSHDRQLAEEAPEIDIVLGGHSHTVLAAPEKVGKTWICQAGSHGRYAGLNSWSPNGQLSGSLHAL